MREQVFISYRREGGDIHAKLICDNLKLKGYTVFYDFDSLKGGYFDDRIFAAIEGCTDFVLVLPPNSLDRCVNEDDWVRQEIVHALKLGKNIIPVMLPGFTFPAVLPKEIEDIHRINGVHFIINYLDSVMATIADRLKSRPGEEAQVEKKPEEKESLIRNVCSFGSCDFGNTSPSDAFYSESIDRNRYNIIYFPITTAQITNKDKITVKMTVYDERGNIKHDGTSEFKWASNYNRITLSWVIRGLDGTFVGTGKYRAVFRVDDSKDYEYEFKITANEHVGAATGGSTAPYVGNGGAGTRTTTPTPVVNPKNPVNSTVTGGNTNNKWLEVCVACPKVFLRYLFTLVGVAIAVYGMSDYTPAATVIGGIIAIIAGISLLRITRNRIVKNFFLALLLVTIGFSYYGWFLGVITVVYIFKGKDWKRQLGI